MTGTHVGAKKSLYVFLSSMLGLLLFLILQRLAAVGYMLLLERNYAKFGLGLEPVAWLAIDYITVMLAMLAGAWYGVWLGLHWFRAVYEDREHGGLVDHLICRYWPAHNHSGKLRGRIEHVSRQLESSPLHLETLDSRLPEVRTIKRPAARRRVVRRKVLKESE